MTRLACNTTTGSSAAAPAATTGQFGHHKTPRRGIDDSCDDVMTRCLDRDVGDVAGDVVGDGCRRVNACADDASLGVGEPHRCPPRARHTPATDFDDELPTGCDAISIAETHPPALIGSDP